MIKKLLMAVGLIGGLFALGALTRIAFVMLGIGVALGGSPGKGLLIVIGFVVFMVVFFGLAISAAKTDTSSSRKISRIETAVGIIAVIVIVFAIVRVALLG